MLHKDLGATLLELKTTLEDIEHELAVGDVSRDILEDFKMAVDHVRLTTWAVLTQKQPDASRAMIAHFRLSRIAEMCRLVVGDVQDGVVTTRTAEVETFRAAAREALECVEEYVKPGK